MKWFIGAIVGGATAGVLLLTGCAAGPDPAVGGQAAVTTPAAAPRSIPPQQFAAAIAEPDRVTINVHVPFEGDLAGTDLSIPYDQIETQANRLPAARDTPLAVYCMSGRMSLIAAEALSKLGYSDVVELDGGMVAWDGAGLPPAVR